MAVVMGNKSASDLVKIEYCGGWGYSSRASYIAKGIEEVFGDKFRVELYRDKGATGRLEVTVTKAGKSQLVHSKAKGEGFVTPDNIGTLMERIKSL